MRRFLWLLILLLPCSAPAAQGFMPGPGLPVNADYCASKLGSMTLYYDADHPTSTTTACIVGGTTTVGLTSTDPTISSSCNLTSGGTNGVCWAGTADKYLAVPNRGLTYATGHIEVKVAFPATMPTANISLFEWFDNTRGVRAILQYGTSQFRISVFHVDGTTVNPTSGYINSTTLAGTTQTFVFDWKDGGNITGTSAAFASSPASTSLGTATSFTVSNATYTIAADELRFGERYNNGTGTALSFDDIKESTSTQ